MLPAPPRPACCAPDEYRRGTLPFTSACKFDLGHRGPDKDTNVSRIGERQGAGGVPFNVLAQASLVRVVVLGHVARAAAARGHDGLLKDGRLEVRRLQLGRLPGVGHVARTTAAVRRELRRCQGRPLLVRCLCLRLRLAAAGISGRGRHAGRRHRTGGSRLRNCGFRQGRRTWWARCWLRANRLVEARGGRGSTRSRGGMSRGPWRVSLCGQGDAGQ